MPSEKTPSHAVRPNASEIWQHFKKESSALVRCNLCSKRFFKTSYASTSQYWTHLRRHHVDVFVTTQYHKEGVTVTANDDEMDGVGIERIPVANAIQIEAETPSDANSENVIREFPFTEGQRKLLEEWFQRIHSHWTQEQECLAEHLGVDENAIKHWFHYRIVQEKHGLLPSDPRDNAPTADEVKDNRTDLVDRVQDSEMSEATDNEEAETPATPAMDHGDAAIPDAHIEHLPASVPHAPFDVTLRLQALQQLQQSLFQPPNLVAPQPIRIQPLVQAAGNNVFESSSHAIMLRLRQLYEKDTKMFLRAQNNINSVIFKYEMENL
ncbi:hypothetical protein AAVH_12329 [Aphelenchoides avenae]|nr:hypothetical protein AAVH_12329 [Aphelenchus avenae]